MVCILGQCLDITDHEFKSSILVGIGMEAEHSHDGLRRWKLHLKSMVQSVHPPSNVAVRWCCPIQATAFEGEDSVFHTVAMATLHSGHNAIVTANKVNRFIPMVNIRRPGALVIIYSAVATCGMPTSVLIAASMFAIDVR